MNTSKVTNSPRVYTSEVASPSVTETLGTSSTLNTSQLGQQNISVAGSHIPNEVQVSPTLCRHAEFHKRMTNLAESSVKTACQ